MEGDDGTVKSSG